MKLRYFYKIDHNKQPIPGSNVRRKSKPGNQWVELFDPCCNPITVPPTSGPRFFIQLDGNNKPVDGSLIRRTGYPEATENIKFMELDWRSPCCIPPAGIKIYLDGVLITSANELTDLAPTIPTVPLDSVGVNSFVMNSSAPYYYISIKLPTLGRASADLDYIVSGSANPSAVGQDDSVPGFWKLLLSNDPAGYLESGEILIVSNPI